MTDFLVVGLGNPGEEYRQTRHNFGFLVLDKLASEMAITCRELPALQAEVASGDFAGHVLYLAKPQTFMNLSGRAVASLARFFRLGTPAQVIVLHDDLDLPLGRLRIKRGGGHGGHKGVRSVIESLGTDGFLRVRLGIGREERPADVVHYVLSPFAPAELERVEEVASRGREAVKTIVAAGVEQAMNEYNRVV